MSFEDPLDRALRYALRRRFEEAAWAYLEVLPEGLHRIEALDSDDRDAVYQAAICFARHGDGRRAASLFLSLGLRERAADVLARTKQDAAAASVRTHGAFSDPPWPPGYVEVVGPEVLDATMPSHAAVTPEAFEARDEVTVEIDDESYDELMPDIHASTLVWQAESAELDVSQPPKARPDEAEVREGELLGERWRIDGLLGRGGYASVYRAFDVELREEVALKLLKREVGDPSALGRFKRELRVARDLNHPGIVDVHGFGVWRDARFITMEMLRGLDLDKLTSRLPDPLPVSAVMNFFRQSLEALGYAHDQGVIHRDIKPSNLFVTRDGRLKLTDFGLARATEAPSDLTAARTVVGSPRFIAPEILQNGGAAASVESDLFALGVTMYVALTGAPPFDGERLMQLITAIMSSKPVPCRDRREGVPPALDDLILSLLAKSPTERPHSCGAVLESLRAIPVPEAA